MSCPGPFISTISVKSIDFHPEFWSRSLPPGIELQPLHRGISRHAKAGRRGCFEWEECWYYNPQERDIIDIIAGYHQIIE